jgi:hypothetical protein
MYWLISFALVPARLLGKVCESLCHHQCSHRDFCLVPGDKMRIPHLDRYTIYPEGGQYQMALKTPLLKKIPMQIYGYPETRHFVLMKAPCLYQRSHYLSVPMLEAYAKGPVWKTRTYFQQVAVLPETPAGPHELLALPLAEPPHARASHVSFVQRVAAKCHSD